MAKDKHATRRKSDSYGSHKSHKSGHLEKSKHSGTPLRSSTKSTVHKSPSSPIQQGSDPRTRLKEDTKEKHGEDRKRRKEERRPEKEEKRTRQEEKKKIVTEGDSKDIKDAGEDHSIEAIASMSSQVPTFTSHMDRNQKRDEKRQKNKEKNHRQSQHQEKDEDVEEQEDGEKSTKKVKASQESIPKPADGEDDEMTQVDLVEVNPNEEIKTNIEKSTQNIKVEIKTEKHDASSTDEGDSEDETQKNDNQIRSNPVQTNHNNQDKEAESSPEIVVKTKETIIKQPEVDTETSSDNGSVSSNHDDVVPTAASTIAKSTIGKSPKEVSRPSVQAMSDLESGSESSDVAKKTAKSLTPAPPTKRDLTDTLKSAQSAEKAKSSKKHKERRDQAKSDNVLGASSPTAKDNSDSDSDIDTSAKTKDTSDSDGTVARNESDSDATTSPALKSRKQRSSAPAPRSSQPSQNESDAEDEASSSDEAEATEVKIVTEQQSNPDTQKPIASIEPVIDTSQDQFTGVKEKRDKKGRLTFSSNAHGWESPVEEPKKKREKTPQFTGKWAYEGVALKEKVRLAENTLRKDQQRYEVFKQRFYRKHAEGTLDNDSGGEKGDSDKIEYDPSKKSAKKEKQEKNQREKKERQEMKPVKEAKEVKDNGEKNAKKSEKEKSTKKETKSKASSTFHTSAPALNPTQRMHLQLSAKMNPEHIIERPSAEARAVQSPTVDPELFQNPAVLALLAQVAAQATIVQQEVGQSINAKPMVDLTPGGRKRMRLIDISDGGGSSVKKAKVDKSD